MKVTVFGSGYVGLVTGACLAEVGNKVMCVDVDPAKIELLNNGGMPIYEPGLAELVQRNRDAGRLLFTTDAKSGVDFGEIQFIAVGTPADEDGSADLQHVLAVARTIGERMTCPCGSAGSAAAGVVSGAAATGAGPAIRVCATLLVRLMRTDSSPSWISISATPDSSSNSMSFLTLRISIVVLLENERAQV